MPCKVEHIKQANDSRDTWYCCSCGDGPNILELNGSCIYCGNHEFCNSGSLPLDPPRSPQNPHPSYNLASDTGTGRGVVPKPPTFAGVTPSPSLDSDNVSNTYRRASDINGIRFTPDSISVATPAFRNDDTIIEQYINYFPDSEPSLGQLPDVPTPRRKSRPNDESTHHAKKNRTLPSSQETGNKQNCRDGEKSDASSQDGQSLGDQRSRKRLCTKNARDSEDSREKGYACQFLKHSPHIYRYTRACCHGFPSISKLKDHLIRENHSPHYMHECDICGDVFSDKSALDGHKQGGQECETKDPRFPAQGVGPRIKKWLESKKLKGGPKGKDAELEDNKWWCDVYRKLFNDDYYGNPYYVNDEVSQSNDPTRQDEYQHLLVQALEHNLPEERKNKMVKFYLRSYFEANLSAKLECFKTLLPESEINRIEREMKELLHGNKDPGQEAASTAKSSKPGSSSVARRLKDQSSSEPLDISIAKHSATPELHTQPRATITQTRNNGLETMEPGVTHLTNSLPSFIGHAIGYGYMPPNPDTTTQSEIPFMFSDQPNTTWSTSMTYGSNDMHLSSDFMNNVNDPFMGDSFNFSYTNPSAYVDCGDELGASGMQSDSFFDTLHDSSSELAVTGSCDPMPNVPLSSLEECRVKHPGKPQRTSNLQSYDDPSLDTPIDIGSIQGFSGTGLDPIGLSSDFCPDNE